MKLIRNPLILPASASVLLASGGCTGNDKEVKPNIVFILIDDMGWKDPGFMGSKYHETPDIDRLARGGMIFTQAYANAANSAPTRACLITGQYAPRHGLYTVANPDRGESQTRRLIPVPNNEYVDTNKISIAEALKPAGYITASIGKWHIGGTPVDHGFDIGFDRNSLGYARGHFNNEGEYLADRLTDEAIKFIEDNNPSVTGRPFFLKLSHHAVHTPIQAKEELIQKYRAKQPDGCHNNPLYAAMVQSVNESVGRVDSTLTALGLSKNTMIVFFSDNGGHGTYTCQKPLRGGKGMFYEGGIREPMFVYWPGIVKGGTSCDIPVISTDFYPTFLDAAGVKKPDDYRLDGLSILPLLRGEKSLSRESLFWHFPAYLEAYEGLMEDARDTLFRSRPVSVIRKGDWKLLLFYEEWVLDGGRDNISMNNSVELYNLKDDIGETENRCMTDIDKRNELIEELLEWIETTGATVPSLANPDYSAEEI